MGMEKIEGGKKQKVGRGKEKGALRYGSTSFEERCAIGALRLRSGLVALK